MKEQINNLINIIKDSETIISGLKNSLIINNNIEYNILIKSWINPYIRIEALTLFETKDGNKGGIYTPVVRRMI